MNKKVESVNIKDIELLVYDFDGVMTDNKVLVFQDGREAVFCNRGDGLAIRKIKKMGILQIIISTERNSVVEARAEKVGLLCMSGVDEKREAVLEYCSKNGIDLSKVVYVGNDVNDRDVMMSVGYPIAPFDAAREIQDIACIITQTKGGDGVIRELLNTFRGFD